jgi:hypothetical protein
VLLLACAAPGCGDAGGSGDGNDGGNDTDNGCQENCEGDPAAMRMTQLTLIDPHAFAFGALDVTGAVNDLIADGLTMDTDNPPDGNLELSVVLQFSPFAAAADATSLEISFPVCTAPASGTTCAEDPAKTPIDADATNMDAVCLDVLPNTTNPSYNPKLTPATARCFVSDAVDVQVPLSDIILPLVEAQIAATYSADGSLENGVLRGFLTEATAMATVIPETIDVVGGMPISSLLQASDQDMGPGGQEGWWFYLNFVASPIAIP